MWELLMNQCSLCFCRMICTCGKQNQNVVLTPDMLRGKTPVGEKVLSTTEALMSYVHLWFKL